MRIEPPHGPRPWHWDKTSRRPCPRGVWRRAGRFAVPESPKIRLWRQHSMPGLDQGRYTL